MALEVLRKNFYTPSPGPGIGVPGGFGTYDLLYDKKTGEVSLKQSGIQITRAVIYENGSYRGDGLRIPELSSNGKDANTTKAEELDRKIKQIVRETALKNKTVLPDFAKESNQNNKPGSNNSFPGTNAGLATALPGGTLLSSEPGAGYNQIKNYKFDIDNEKQALGGTTKYPNDMDGSQDRLLISQFRYKPPYGDQFLKGSPADIFKQGLQRNSALLEDLIGTVILPMPAGVKDSNTVRWGPDTMNDMTAAVTSKFMQGSLPGNAATVFAPQIMAQLLSSLPGLDSLNKIPPEMLRHISVLASSLGAGALDNPNIRPAIDSLLLNAAGFEVSPETILAKGFGIVPNSNMELLFNGVELRSFQFAYRLSPRNKPEAKDVRKIIRFFKQGMAARKSNFSGSAAGTRSIFLSTPNVFKLQYKSGNSLMKGVNKFKICALTGCSVDYSPDGNWSSYEDPSSPGQPVSVTMALNFQEIEPVYANDYQESILNEKVSDVDIDLRNDLQNISLDDVGY